LRPFYILDLLAGGTTKFLFSNFGVVIWGLLLYNKTVGQIFVRYENTKDAVYVIAVENYSENNDYLIEFHKMVNSFYVYPYG